MNVIKDIREKQNQLIVMINTMFDEMVRDVERFSVEGNEINTDYETVYPITNTTGFKGKKPIAVMIGNERIITPTWKAVVESLLKEILKDATMKAKILDLRDRLLGRVRKRVSNTPEKMRSPIKLCEDLYIETHYDTETLMNLLLQILKEISYNYNNLKVIIKN